MRRLTVILCAANLVLAILAGWTLSSALRFEPTVASSNVEMREIRLVDGESLTLPLRPLRILPGNAGILDLISALVGPERIVAIPKASLTWSRISEEREAYGDHPVFAEYSAEILIAQRPDLVVTGPFNAPDTDARLRELKVPVLSLPEAQSLEEVIANLRVLGEALDEASAARAMIVDLEQRGARLAERRSGRARLRVVAYSNYGDGGWSAGPGTSHHEIIRLAGLENAVKGSGHQRFSFEQLVALDPDLILTGEIFGEEDEGTLRILRGEPGLANLKALRNDGVILLPPRLISASSQEILRGAERLVDRLEELER